MSDEQTHYQASLILLLEKQYKQAYFHLPFVTIDESLNALKNLFIIIQPSRYEMLYHKDKDIFTLYAR